MDSGNGSEEAKDEQGADTPGQIELGGKKWNIEWSSGAFRRLARKHGPVFGTAGVGLRWNLSDIDMLFDVLAEMIGPQRGKLTTADWVEARVKPEQIWPLANRLQPAILDAMGMTAAAGVKVEDDETGEATRASSTQGDGSSSPAKQD